MIGRNGRRLGFGVATAALGLGLLIGAPATAHADQGGGKITPAAIEAALKGDAKAKWKALPKAKKDLTVQILSEDTFGLPAEAAGLQKKYPDLKVTESEGSEVDSAASTTAVRASKARTSTASKSKEALLTTAALTGRTSWVSQYWSILGIDYATIRTTIGYETSGGVVRSVSRCYGTYTNYVPLRSIDKESWYTLGNGLADCWTEWTLCRLVGGCNTGIQGLRVNGYGQIIKRWNV